MERVDWVDVDEAVVPRGDSSEPAAGVVGSHPADQWDAGSRRRHAGAQWTIFDNASSMMSVAPRSFNAGMRTLMSLFGTTVSTA